MRGARAWCDASSSPRGAIRKPATCGVTVSPLSDLPVQLIEVERPPGAEVAYPAAAFAFIRQAIWVISGTLDFAEGTRLHQLRPGDCPRTRAGGRLCVRQPRPDALSLPGRGGQALAPG